MLTDRPNVVFVILDTARASAFQTASEHHSSATPAFADLAMRGRTCTHAIAPAPWTLPSHVSFFSGLMPSEHGLMGDAWDAGSLPSVAPLIERVGPVWLPIAAKDAGYDTFSGVANGWVGRRTGFDAGFDGFVSLLSDGQTSVTTRLRAAAQKAFAPGDNGGPRLVAAFERWVAARGTATAPFFAFLNLLEPHAPYDPPDVATQFSRDERARAKRLIADLHTPDDLMIPFNVGRRDLTDIDQAILQRLYEAEVQVADRAIERLLSHLDATGVLDDTVVVLASDHGENVGEHHLLAHNMSMHETLLHVPLVLAGPDIPHDQIDVTVSALDIHPTLLGLLTGAAQERSLISPASPVAPVAPVAPAAKTEQSARVDVWAEYEGAVHQVRALARAIDHDPTLATSLPPLARSKGVAAYAGRHKAVASGDRVEVFDLDADPTEQAPLIDPTSDDAQAAYRSAVLHLSTLEGRHGTTDDQSVLDEEIRVHLEGLGYL